MTGRKMKKLILLFAVILCAALFGLRQMHAAAVTRESAQILQVNLLAEFPVPEGGHGHRLRGDQSGEGHR